MAGADGEGAAVGAVDFVLGFALQSRRIGAGDAVAAVGAGAGDCGAQGLVVGGEFAVGLEDLACAEEAAVFEADVLHQGEGLFDEGFVVPPPLGPGRDGFGESDGFAEMGKALLAESFGVGHGSVAYEPTGENSLDENILRQTVRAFPSW